VKPKFINPLLLEKHMPLLEVFQDEAVGMAFSVDSQYLTLSLKVKMVLVCNTLNQRYMSAGRHSKNW